MILKNRKKKLNIREHNLKQYQLQKPYLKCAF